MVIFLMLGFEVAQSTVSKYIVRPSKPPSQSWKTFLRNHAQAIAAIDPCVVPTLTFDRLFAFLVLGHARRQLLWIEVTHDAKPQDLSPAVPHDQQSVELSERDGRNDKQIHRRDPICVVAEKRLPALRHGGMDRQPTDGGLWLGATPSLSDPLGSKN